MDDDRSGIVFRDKDDDRSGVRAPSEAEELVQVQSVASKGIRSADLTRLALLQVALSSQVYC